MRDTSRLLLIAFITLLSFMATACAGASSDEGTPPQVDGPALVMFYTDN